MKQPRFNRGCFMCNGTLKVIYKQKIIMWKTVDKQVNMCIKDRPLCYTRLIRYLAIQDYYRQIHVRK